MPSPIKFLDATASRDKEDPHLKHCQAEFDAFRHNISIAIGSSYIPGFAYFIARSDLTATETAKGQILGLNPTAMTEKEWLAILPSIIVRSRHLLERAVNIHRNKQIEHMRELTHMFETVALQNPFILGVMEGMLKSIFIQTWTSIEVFCGAILNECIPKHPACFLPSNKVVYYTSKTKEMKKHFERAFEDDPTINSLIHDKYIAAVAALRHSLIHKHGKVEKLFRGDAELASPLLDQWKALPDGQKIEFTGTMVFDMIDPAVGKVYDLAQAIDDWIERRKVKSYQP